jgi:hypothetical protein
MLSIVGGVIDIWHWIYESPEGVGRTISGNVFCVHIPQAMHNVQCICLCYI